MKPTKLTKKKSKTEPYAKFTNWCLDEGWRIQKLLDLTNYRIRINLKPEKTNDDYAFEIKVNYPYHNATLKWQEDTFHTWKEDKKKVSEYLLHEMLHILIQPLEQLTYARYVTAPGISNEVESLTDHLTNLLRHHVVKGMK